MLPLYFKEKCVQDREPDPTASFTSGCWYAFEYQKTCASVLYKMDNVIHDYMGMTQRDVVGREVGGGVLVWERM